MNALDHWLIGPKDGNGIIKFDGSEWENYNISNSGLSSNTVFNIVVDEEDNIWCGTYNGGLAKL